MQTFLPYESFRLSAQCLDRQRLGKQRLEALQIHAVLIGKQQGYRNHPAVRMWDGHVEALLLYGIRVCEEWRKRGYQDTIGPFMETFFGENYGPLEDASPILPAWLGAFELHQSHRSNLIRKDAAHYQKLWPDVPADLPYWWPTVALDPAETA